MRKSYEDCGAGLFFKNQEAQLERKEIRVKDIYKKLGIEGELYAIDPLYYFALYSHVVTEKDVEFREELAELVTDLNYSVSKADVKRIETMTAWARKTVNYLRQNRSQKDSKND
jgi:hypothetical protein